MGKENARVEGRSLKGDPKGKLRRLKEIVKARESAQDGGSRTNGIQGPEVKG
jgi:hypothetical protein